MCADVSPIHVSPHKDGRVRRMVVVAVPGLHSKAPQTLGDVGRLALGGWWHSNGTLKAEAAHGFNSTRRHKLSHRERSIGNG